MTSELKPRPTSLLKVLPACCHQSKTLPNLVEVQHPVIQNDGAAGAKIAVRRHMNTGGAELFHPPGRKMGNVQDGADHVEQVYQPSNNGYVLLTRGKIYTSWELSYSKSICLAQKGLLQGTTPHMPIW